MGSDDPVKKTKDLYAIFLKSHEKNTKIFTKIRNSTKFKISHSAKDVVYDCANFIERNSDSMSTSLDELIK